jgi:hypothetical protein
MTIIVGREKLKKKNLNFNFAKMFKLISSAPTSKCKITLNDYQLKLMNKLGICKIDPISIPGKVISDTFTIPNNRAQTAYAKVDGNKIAEFYLTPKEYFSRVPGIDTEKLQKIEKGDGDCMKFDPKSRPITPAFQPRKVQRPSRNRVLREKKSIAQFVSRKAVISSSDYNAKITEIVDKLQNPDWEASTNGLQMFMTLAKDKRWDRKVPEKFISTINRKLIDLLRSPRSNLCRKACEASGDFFEVTKCTKRPEFDEIVDLLLSKCADQNQFIKKAVNVALDKIIASIPFPHSIRALTVHGPNHKNPAVRIAASRLVADICDIIGHDQIIGTAATSQTRKRVMESLAKFLVDKNVTTRRNAERIVRTLREHPYFEEHFFIEIESKNRTALEKVLENIQK